MPVRQAIVGRQKTLAGLTKTLFDVKGDRELQERAEVALLNANPCLVHGIPAPGTPIIVPDIGTEPARAQPAAVIPEDVLRTIREGAAALADLAGPRLDAALKEQSGLSAMLKAKATADAVVAARPDLKDKLPAIAAEAEEETKRTAATVAKLRAAIAGFERAIAGEGGGQTQS